LFLPGCTSLDPASAPEPPPAAEPALPSGGFLGDYSEFRPGPSEDLLWVYRKEKGVLAAYDAFLIEPVLVFFGPETTGGGIEPGELRELADHLRGAGLEELGKAGFSVVDTPGPRVARIRLAITGVKPIRPEQNLGTKALGMVAGIGLLVPSVDVGRASIEAEILDSVSGERLVAVVASREGRRFFNLKNSSTRWGDAKAAFKKWARALGERLEELRAARTPEP
jgi:hypothetical protein